MDSSIRPDLYYTPLGGGRPVRRSVEPPPLPSESEIERKAIALVAGAVRRRAKCPEAEDLTGQRETVLSNLANLSHRRAMLPPWSLFERRRLGLEINEIRARLVRIEVQDKRGERLDRATAERLLSGEIADFDELKGWIADSLALKREMDLRRHFLAKIEEMKAQEYRCGLYADQDAEFAQWQRDYQVWMGQYRDRALAIEDHSGLIPFGNRFQIKLAGELADQVIENALAHKRQETVEIGHYDHS